MIERELKLHVPTAARAGIGKALRARKAKKISLQARYFDTPARDLANAQIALRLRLEGKQWMQTIKCPGPDTLSRIELNHPRPEPTLDLSVYKGTHIGAILTRLKKPLALRFETRVTRLVLLVETPQAVVELAYDQGAVCANDLELPISELEFELISGDSTNIFTMAQEWTEQYGLILDLRSKAERGDTLAKIAQDIQDSNLSADKHASAPIAESDESAATRIAEQLARPRRASSANLNAKMSVDQAYLACANECLIQIIRNATFVAGVDTANTTDALQAEYIHQLRVAIRRLRSCWRLFNGWVPSVDESLSASLNQNFKSLGESRDIDVIKLEIAPQLESANMPQCALPAGNAGAQNETTIAARPEFQTTLIQLLATLVTQGDTATSVKQPIAGRKKAATGKASSGKTPTGAPASAFPLKRELRKRLNDWLQKAVSQGVHFEKLTIEEQHDLRKMIKRLRYSLDFSEGAVSAPGWERLHSMLTQIQQVLGNLNDFYMAEHFYAALIPAQPQAWFAIGWLRAMQHQQKAHAQIAFKQLAKLDLLKA